MNLRNLSVLSLGLASRLSAAGAPPRRRRPRKRSPRARNDARRRPRAPIFDSDAIGAEADRRLPEGGPGLRPPASSSSSARTNALPAARSTARFTRSKFFAAFINQFVPVYVDVSSGTNAIAPRPTTTSTRAAEQPGIVILMPDARIIEVLAQGEMAALTRKGDAAVQEFFLARFLKTEK